MPLAFIKSLTRKNVVFHNLLEIYETNSPSKGGEQIHYREKGVSKILMHQRKNIYITTGYFKSNSLSLPPSKPLYWVEDSCFLCYQKTQNIFGISLIGTFLWHDSVGVVKFLTGFSQHYSSLTQKLLKILSKKEEVKPDIKRKVSFSIEYRS